MKKKQKGEEGRMRNNCMPQSGKGSTLSQHIKQIKGKIYGKEGKILQEEGVQHPSAMVVQFVVWPEKPKSLKLVTKAKVE